MRHELWPVVSGLLVFVGLLSSNGLLLVVGSLVAIVWLGARVWERYCFRKVSYEREVERLRAFIGDTVEYTVSLANDKPLPLIWVETQDPFPEGLELAGAVVRGKNRETNRHHSITTSLLPYQKASWKIQDEVRFAAAIIALVRFACEAATSSASCPPRYGCLALMTCWSTLGL